MSLYTVLKACCVFSQCRPGIYQAPYTLPCTSCCFPQMTHDIDKEVRALSQNFPYVVLLTGGENTEFCLVAERQVIATTEDFMEVLTGMIGAYFTLNIQYPKALYPVYIFIQHYVLGLKDCQPVPNSLTRVLSSLDNLLAEH